MGGIEENREKLSFGFENGKIRIKCFIILIIHILDLFEKLYFYRLKKKNLYFEFKTNIFFHLSLDILFVVRYKQEYEFQQNSND